MVGRVVRNGEVIGEVPLRYAGEKNTFAGQVPLTTIGPVELHVLAMDPANSNFGLVRRNLTVLGNPCGLTP